jgi:hypothetical protein
VGQAKAKRQLGKLVAQRTGIDHRHWKQLLQIWNSLVHGRRAHTDDIGAVLLDATQRSVTESWEDYLLFPAQKVLDVGWRVDRADRGAE